MPEMAVHILAFLVPALAAHSIPSWAVHSIPSWADHSIPSWAVHSTPSWAVHTPTMACCTQTVASHTPRRAETCIWYCHM